LFLLGSYQYNGWSSFLPLLLHHPRHGFPLYFFFFLCPRLVASLTPVRVFSSPPPQYADSCPVLWSAFFYAFFVHPSGGCFACGWTFFVPVVFLYKTFFLQSFCPPIAFPSNQTPCKKCLPRDKSFLVRILNLSFFGMGFLGCSGALCAGSLSSQKCSLHGFWFSTLSLFAPWGRLSAHFFRPSFFSRTGRCPLPLRGFDGTAQRRPGRFFEPLCSFRPCSFQPRVVRNHPHSLPGRMVFLQLTPPFLHTQLFCKFSFGLCISCPTRFFWVWSFFFTFDPCGLYPHHTPPSTPFSFFSSPPFQCGFFDPHPLLAIFDVHALASPPPLTRPRGPFLDGAPLLVPEQRTCPLNASFFSHFFGFFPSPFPLLLPR